MRALDWDQIDPLGASSELDLGAAELCAIVEETGRALAPTPLVPCLVGRTILRGAGARATASLPVLAHTEPARTRDRLRATATARVSDAVHRLTGTKRFVAYGLQADLLLVSATREDGELAIYAVDPDAPGIERRRLVLLDASPCGEIELHDVELAEAACLASGEPARRAIGEALALESLARCAELVGVGARALELAVDYARDRIAFGRPIGSFQAVQHRLVDLRGHVEVARALYQGAAGKLTGPAGERDVAVSMAAFAALDDLRKVPEGALQVFGGIGTTWEHDIHFFVRRAATLCGLLGERSGFREVVAASLAAGL
jgi:alkylation response protein AidB-like acyl-CoA dehydrogenase